MAEKMYFGVPGNIQEIPLPKTGMGIDLETDTEVTQLVSGGRSVYRAPTGFKSFNMTWATTASRLRHLTDMYGGQFGPGPFYMTDPSVDQENVLPASWSNGWQLAHQGNGWCRPRVLSTPMPTTPSQLLYRTNRAAVFTQATTGTPKLEGVVRTRLIRVPGKDYYFLMDGAMTGGAAVRIRGYNNTTGTWTNLSLVSTPNSLVIPVVASNTNITMLEVGLYMPLGSTMTISGMSLGTLDPTVIKDLLWTNQSTNPAWRSVGAATMIRTNFVANPDAAAGGSNWNVTNPSGASTSGHITGATPAELPTNTFFRFTVTTATGTWMRANQEHATQTVAAGQNGSASAYVRLSKASANGYMGIQWIDASNAIISEAPLNSQALVGNTWRRLELPNITAPAGAVRFLIYVGVAGGLAVNDTFDVTGALFETRPVVLPYFSANTPTTPDITYAWSGTANQSRSTFTVIPVNGYGNVNGQIYGYRGTVGGHNGFNYARGYLLSTGAAGVVPTDMAGIYSGETRTGLLWVRPSRSLPLQARWRNNTSGINVNVGPLVTYPANEWTEVRYTAAPAGDDLSLGFLLAANQGQRPGDTIDISEHLNVPGTYTGDYFDGATTDRPDAKRYYRWFGAADASGSYVVTTEPTDWMSVGQGVGPVQFDGSYSGSIVSTTIDRIGLSLDFVEVESVDG